jgi:hypothetical protein
MASFTEDAQKRLIRRSRCQERGGGVGYGHENECRIFEAL